MRAHLEAAYPIPVHASFRIGSVLLGSSAPVTWRQFLGTSLPLVRVSMGALLVGVLVLTGCQTEPSAPDAATADAGSSQGDAARPEVADASSADAGQGDAHAPRVEVEPTQVDFGSVQVATYQRRRVSLRNHLGAACVLERPALDSSEFSVEWPPLGYPPAGLPSGGSVDLVVRFAPLSAGPKAATLQLRAGSQDLSIPLSGQGHPGPDCTWDVTPSALSFGNVSEGKPFQFSVYFLNRGRDTGASCLIERVGLSTDSSPGITLPNGTQQDIVVAASDVFEVPLRFELAPGSALKGALEFRVASLAKPTGQVVFQGQGPAGTPWLWPEKLEFGSIGVGTSPELAFTLYNISTGTLELQTLEVQPAPQPFSLASTPSVPLRLEAGASTSFQVRYAPSVAGSHEGSLLLRFAGGGSAVLPLSGSCK